MVSSIVRGGVDGFSYFQRGVDGFSYFLERV
jgi:hypothetical protein